MKQYGIQGEDTAPVTLGKKEDAHAGTSGCCHIPWQHVVCPCWQAAADRVQIGRQEISDTLGPPPDTTEGLRKAQISRGAMLT